MKVVNKITVLFIDRDPALMGRVSLGLLSLSPEFELLPAVDFQSAAPLLGWSDVGAIILSINAADDPAWTRDQFDRLRKAFPKAPLILYLAQGVTLGTAYGDAYAINQPLWDDLTQLIIVTAHEAT